MNRLVRRQRAALALFIALTVSGVGVALADPQGEQPGVTIDVSPNNGQNLPDTQTVTVTGAGFGSNQSGLIVQAAELPNGTTALSNTLGTFTSNAAGAFTTTATVTRTFVAAGTGETIDCNAPGVQCYVQATSTSGQFQALHTISFAGGAVTTTTSTTLLPTTTTSTTLLPTTTSSTIAPTTTSSTVAPTTTTIGGGPVTTVGPTQCAQIRAARAQLNAQIDAARVSIIQSGLSPQQQAATLAQLEAIRAQGNAQLDALLAGCPAP
ncbi:MAG TPA: hypothetical protein VM388_03930 [Acidimicrobiales bacterium]|nr:hypothetical protein [Acidimicrobiales bacterium]